MGPPAPKLDVPAPAWASQSPEQPPSESSPPEADNDAEAAHLSTEETPSSPIASLPATEESHTQPTKRPAPDSPARTAVVPAGNSPQRRPASSLGKLLGQLPPSSPALAPAPLKKPRTARWMSEIRGTALVEVPIEDLDTTPADADADVPAERPHRVRMKPLEFWRNERVIYERLPGAQTPSVCRVLLNVAPRAEDLPKRSLALQAVPVVADGQQAEFLSNQTSCISSKLVVLPPWTSTVSPPTFALPAGCMGHVFVIEGSLRYAFEGEQDMAIINAGDHLLLEQSEGDKLLGCAGARGAGEGVKFKVFLITSSQDAFMPPLNNVASRGLL